MLLLARLHQPHMAPKRWGARQPGEHRWLKNFRKGLLHEYFKADFEQEFAAKALDDARKRRSTLSAQANVDPCEMTRMDREVQDRTEDLRFREDKLDEVNSNYQKLEQEGVCVHHKTQQLHFLSEWEQQWNAELYEEEERNWEQLKEDARDRWLKNRSQAEEAASAKASSQDMANTVRLLAILHAAYGRSCVYAASRAFG